MKNRRAVGLLNPMRDKNRGKNRGEEGTTPVTTTCPEAGKWKCEKKKKKMSTKKKLKGPSMRLLAIKHVPKFQLLTPKIERCVATWIPCPAQLERCVPWFFTREDFRPFFPRRFASNR